MAERITDLPVKTSGFSLADVIEWTDVSDTTDNPSGTSYQATIGDVLNDLGVGISIPGFENYVVYKATGNEDETALELGDRVEGVGAYFGGDYIIATVATAPVTVDGDFNTPLFRAASI